MGRRSLFDPIKRGVAARKDFIQAQAAGYALNWVECHVPLEIMTYRIPRLFSTAVLRGAAAGPSLGI
jgi:hypothetical protein